MRTLFNGLWIETLNHSLITVAKNTLGS